MVRILHVLSKDLPSSTIRQVSLLAERSSANSFEHQFCSLDSDKKRQKTVRLQLGYHGAADRVSGALSFCPQSMRIDPTLVSRLGFRLRKARPDVTHYWGEATNLAVWIAHRFHGDCPVIASVEQPIKPTSFANRWLRWNTHFVINHQLSPTANHGLSPASVTLIRDGVPAPQSRMRAIDSQYTDLGIDPSAKLIVAKNDLTHRNRFRDLIWALDLLRVLHNDVHLLLIGEGGADEDLRDYANRALTHNNVAHFAAPKLASEEQALFAKCACFWHASPRCSASILEAMSCGLPIVASDSPNARDILQENDSGFLVPTGDSAEFARKTNFLLNDKTLADRIGRAARNRAREEFSADAMVQGYISAYKRVIALKNAA